MRSEKMLCGISEMVSARAFKLSKLNLLLSKCSGVKHTSRDFWSSRNERKPLYKLKLLLSKCSGVSQTRWMLELSNLCHCVQHPWKLTSRDFWSSRNERKPLSQQKCILRKCCVVSQKWSVLELSNLAIVFSTPENLLVGITRALETKESHFLG